MTLGSKNETLEETPVAIIYTILGDANTRKSSTIRALTGVGQHRSALIATVAGFVDVYVEISALQEAGISAARFIRIVTAGGHQNVLVPLRDNPFNGQPSGAAYIQAFIAAGWVLQAAVVLGAAALVFPLPASLPPPNAVPNSALSPANQTAATVRNW